MNSPCRRAPFTVMLVLAALLTTAGPVQAGPVERNRVRGTFFGIDVAIGPKTDAAWPQFAPGAVRVHLSWSSVERRPSSYDWAVTDAKVAAAQRHGAQPLLVLAGTPAFSSTDGAQATPASAPRLAHYKSFVRALVERYQDRADYQVWNEPNIPLFYTGTMKHMAKMTRIVHKAVRDLAPEATVVAPSFPVRTEQFKKGFRKYWSQRVYGKPVGNFVDVANLSAYPLVDDGPEEGLRLTQWARRATKKRDFDGPIWVSEINYGANGLAATERIPVRRQVSFVVRTYVLHAAQGADRVYWWRWEPHATVNTQLQDGSGNLTPAGTAYGVVRGWILGSRPTGCSITRGVTTCGFRVGDGVRREISWTRSERIRPLVVPEGAVRRVDPAGVESSVTPGAKIRVGVTPVMIEVRRPR